MSLAATVRTPSIFVWEESGLTAPSRSSAAPAAKPDEPKRLTWAEIHGPRSGKGPSRSENRRRKAAKAFARRQAELLARFDRLEYSMRFIYVAVRNWIASASDMGELEVHSKQLRALEVQHAELQRAAS